jgi:hypothetical protein
MSMGLLAGGRLVGASFTFQDSRWPVSKKKKIHVTLLPLGAFASIMHLFFLIGIRNGLIGLVIDAILEFLVATMETINIT